MTTGPQTGEMRPRLIGAACLVVAVVQGPFLYGERIGVARWRDNKGCLALFKSSIRPATKVTLVEQPVSGDPPRVTQASIENRVSQPCDVGLAGVNSQGVAPSFYQVATANSAAPPTGVLFAILDPPMSIGVRNGRVEADLDGDGLREVFRTCTSSETVHLMVWTGLPAEGRPRWHGTFYAGYDMVPSCTAQDEAGMVALAKQGVPAATDAVTEVRAVWTTQVAAWNKQDLEGFMAAYWKSPDLVFFSNGTETRGWQATLDRYRAKYRGEGKEMGTLDFPQLEFVALGPDAVLARGRWRLKLSGGKEASGMTSVLFRKLPEGWRIVHDHSSADTQ